MNYELAKELKDAGFPQEGAGEYQTDEGSPAVPGVNNGSIYIPTLSELIEACGEDFASLHKHGVIWDCMPTTGLLESGVGCWSGDTPLEAVARLWLALHAPEVTEKEV